MKWRRRPEEQPPVEPAAEPVAEASTAPSAATSSYEELRAGFTASVSHELRTPLARLLAMLESAELPGTDPAEVIRSARREVEEMRELVDDILFLSELETGRQVVSLGETAVLPVLRDVQQELAINADHSAVVIRVLGDDSLTLPLRPRMLHVVAHNLAENAVRYAGSGATIELRVEGDGNMIELVVSDDGVGVAEEDLPRLFERFYRSDRARSSRGTGLGLAIVKHVVTAAGGEAVAEGGPGRGLTIRCRLPRS